MFREWQCHEHYKAGEFATYPTADGGVSFWECRKDHQAVSMHLPNPAGPDETEYWLRHFLKPASARATAGPPARCRESVKEEELYDFWCLVAESLTGKLSKSFMEALDDLGRNDPEKYHRLIKSHDKLFNSRNMDEANAATIFMEASNTTVVVPAGTTVVLPSTVTQENKQ